MNNTINFNLNDYIHVKLTVKGRKILRENHDDLYKTYTGDIKYRPPVEDKNGYSKWQLWDFMHSLGPRMVMGIPGVCATNIKIEVKEVTKKKSAYSYAKAHADVVVYYRNREGR